MTMAACKRGKTLISSLLSGLTANPGTRFAAGPLLTASLGEIGTAWAIDATSNRTPTWVIAKTASTPKSDPRFMSQAEFEKLDCKSRWRIYRQSQECFAPYIQQPRYPAPPDAYPKCGISFQDPSRLCKIEALP